jgi:uroporphyrinogen-III synthase
MNVVVTREAGQNEEARLWLPDGVVVHEVPLTSTRYFSHDEVTKELQATKDFGSFNVLVVTSARTAHFIDAAQGALASGAHVLSVGPKTTRALSDNGVAVSGEAVSSQSELDPMIERGPVLLFGATHMREELGDALARRSIPFTRVACYETVPLSLGDDDAALLKQADVVLIGAPSAWSVARDFINESTWVVVPGGTTTDVVSHDHARVFAGWGPSLRSALTRLYPDVERRGM